MNNGSCEWILTVREKIAGLDAILRYLGIEYSPFRKSDNIFSAT